MFLTLEVESKLELLLLHINDSNEEFSRSKIYILLIFIQNSPHYVPRIALHYLSTAI